MYEKSIRINTIITTARFVYLPIAIKFYKKSDKLFYIEMFILQQCCYKKKAKFLLTAHPESFLFFKYERS